MLVLLYLSSLLILSLSTFHGHRSCSSGSISLTSNSSVSYRLCVTEFWATVHFMDTICGNEWSLKNSLVVCKQLGYLGVWTYANFGIPHMQRSGVSFRCNGTEDEISECYRKAGVTVDGNCSALSVGCRQLVSTSDVRLVNSNLDTVGDVEVFFNGTWMSLCYHNINDFKANHVCKQLGWQSGRVIIPPVTKGVDCVGWNCDDENCTITRYLNPDWAARVECQQYNVTNTMSLDVSLNDDGVPLVIHEGRRARICISDDVLDGGADCENVSTLPLAICERLGYNDIKEIENQTSMYSTQQLPILIGGPSNCTACSPSLPQQTFLDKFTICLPDDVDACDVSVDIVLTCTNTITEGDEDGGFGLGAILGIIIGVLLVLLFLSPFIGSTLKSCYKKCVKPWISSDRASTHPTATTNPGRSKASESRGGHSMALSTSEAEPSTYESSTLTKTHSSTGVKTDALPNYNEAMKSPEHNDSTM